MRTERRIKKTRVTFDTVESRPAVRLEVVASQGETGSHHLHFVGWCPSDLDSAEFIDLSSRYRIFAYGNAAVTGRYWNGTEEPTAPGSHGVNV